MNVAIYHNPRCSKSRQALELIQEKGIKPHIIEYLKEPPTVDELKTILQMLGIAPRDLLRKKEDAYKEAGLDDASVQDDAIIHAMAQYPILIERPIVLANGKAVLGRPPENILQIL